MVGRTGDEMQLSVSMKSAELAPLIWILERLTACAPKLFRTMSCAALDCPAVVDPNVSEPGAVPSVGPWIP